jgi:hypothetical protein
VIVKKNWELVLASMVGAVTIGAGVWQFSAQQSQANKKPFLEEQLGLAFDISNTVGTLATETDQESWRKARKNFWRLYWGPLVIVENPAVEKAMYELGKQVPKMNETVPSLPMSHLQIPSYELSTAIREMVLSSWDVNLPALSDDRLPKK